MFHAELMSSLAATSGSSLAATSGPSLAVTTSPSMAATSGPRFGHGQISARTNAPTNTTFNTLCLKLGRLINHPIPLYIKERILAIVHLKFTNALKFRD